MIGRHLLHYEILDRIGEGGMGVVYKARDTHLDRLVAIKILPPHKLSNPDRRRRFVQEAKAASALNHPGIVTIHDIADDDGIDFISMELVAGRTLDDLVPRGGLRLRDVLDYGIQIADALAAAHAGGIVHRDLKPSNVMVTDHGQVKLLDFGLAKLVERDAFAADARTVTTPPPITVDGAIIGTLAYMAPEQAEGKSADPRADVFSFGAVLYEMVTGDRAFHGDSPLATLTAVLREEPKAIPHSAEEPAHELERIIRRCLRKDPDRRWQSMADVRVALRELKEESDSANPAVISRSAVRRPRSRRMWAAVATAVLVLLMVAFAAVSWLNRHPAAIATGPTSAVPLTTYHGREQQPALSSDGNSVAFAWNGEREDNWDIWVTSIGAGSPLRLTSDPALDLAPAWSPDGRSIAFVRVRGERRTVLVVPPLGGPEREVVEMEAGALGYGQALSWSPNSQQLVVAGPIQTGTLGSLFSVDVVTGETKPIVTRAGASYMMPAVSPDGKALAFIKRSGALAGELYVQPLSDGLMPLGVPRLLDGQGRLYYGLTWSADGTAVIVSWGNTGDIGVWRVPLDHPDRPERISPPGEDWRQPSVSQRQNRLAATRATWDENMWRVDLAGPGRPAGAPVSLSGSTRSELNAQFSPDGKRIVFESFRSGTQEVWLADTDGRNARQLTTFNGVRGGTPAWSPDGQRIAFDMRNADGKGDLYVAPLRGGSIVRLTTDPADDIVPTWSHDGHWIYFESTRTGGPEIWKMPASGGHPTQITRDGATYAKESVDGRYLYYSRFGNGLRSLRRIDTSGRGDVQVIPLIAHYGNFAVVKEGVYFEAAPPAVEIGLRSLLAPLGRGARIDFFSFAPGGRITTVLTLTQYAGHGLDVSPDGRTLLFGQMDGFSEDLLLLENVR